MAEPQASAERLERVCAGLLHWTIADERIGGHRSDSYALSTSEGLVLIDPVGLRADLERELHAARALFLTHGNHQRAAWRLRRELGLRVYAPRGVTGLDEEPDALLDGETPLPAGMHAWPARGFADACYLSYEPAEGPSLLFCGDLLVRDGDGYRFPVQPGYFELEGGRVDARRLASRPHGWLCAAHAGPVEVDCQALLEELARG